MDTSKYICIGIQKIIYLAALGKYVFLTLSFDFVNPLIGEEIVLKKCIVAQSLWQRNRVSNS